MTRNPFYGFFKGSAISIFILSILFCLPLVSATTFEEDTLSCKEIIRNMSSSIEKINSLKFTLKKKERVEGDLKFGEQDVKFIRSPRQIYTIIKAPNQGVEILWLEGKNNGKAYINPNAFPYISLSLDPYGNIMRKGNHHTVHEVGMDYINSIINYIAEKTDGDFYKIFSLKGEVVFNNRKCYKVLIDYTPYDYVNYTMLEGETITSVAYKLFVSDYMILELNKDIKDYSYSKPGKTILVPNAYARKTILYIDKETFMPVVQMMFDEKGLFSQYEFHDLKLNPGFSGEEFTKSYKDYHF